MDSNGELVGDHDAGTSQLSRSHHFERPVPGLVSVKGGKCTTYRVMTAGAVDAAVAEMARQGEAQPGGTSVLGVTRTSSPLGLSVASSPTPGTVLVGSADYDRFSDPSVPQLRAADFGSAGVGALQVAHLIARHGDQITELLEPVAISPELAAPPADGHPYLAAEVVYAVRASQSPRPRA